MVDWISRILGEKINGVRVTPLVVKIVTIFTVFLLVSNFTTNYINLMLNRGEQIRLLNQLLVKDLKELHVFSGNQHEIYNFNPDLQGAVENIEAAAVRNHRGERSLSIGVKETGEVFFQAGNMEEPAFFPDEEALERMLSAPEGTINFRFAGYEYFGAYKYNNRWEIYQVRAEELSEFYADSERIFWQVSAIIFGISIVFVVIGIWILQFILRFVRILTDSIMRMQMGQTLEIMDMTGAPNDDITYLGVAFNSLSNTIDNLLTIFKKFVARDVAAKAYREREIRLEGAKRDLTILFTDIRSFTFMTETLGTDIIKLLNLHYDQAISHIHHHNGDIGSIIGDALLAVFGTVQEDDGNKSLEALHAAYKIHEVTASLRKEMYKRREEILKQRGSFTDAEERVFRAVLLEVGVGIDGGEVFYGNIGSNERMVNTVIGDNVNSASRLEGLTRFYKVPVIVSEYVKGEVAEATDEYEFMELDSVRVKGKTQGKKVFWPIMRDQFDDRMRQDVEEYTQALRYYYQGDWPTAATHFDRCTFPVSRIFSQRIADRSAPDDWNGVWSMSEK